MANLFDEYRQELAQRNSSNVKRFRDNEINYGDFYNNWAKGSGYETTLQEEPNDTIGNGFFGHTVDSAQAGAAGSLSGAARFLEEFSPVGNEWLGEFANDMDKIVKRNTPLQPLEGTDWIAGALGNAIGSGIPSIVAGAAIIGVAGAVGAAVPASIAAGVIRARQAIPALNRIVTATKEMWKSPFASKIKESLDSPLGKLAKLELAGSGFEGVTEAGNLIGEMRDKGYTDEEIRNAAIASATMNTGWLLVANAIGGAMTAKYGKEAVKGGLKQMVKNAGKGAIIEGSGEAVQEYGQSLIGNVAEGTELDHEAAREAAAQAFVGSGILGGFGGAAAPYINNKPTKASKTQTAEEQTEAENKDTGNEPSVETETTVTPEVEQARNEIIGYRETLDEDDAEFGRLSELLENGNDEEIIAEAQAIRGAKTEAEEATPATQEESTPEVKEVEPEFVGEVVDATTLETPIPKQEETGGKEDGETNVSPQGETVKPPENTGDNGESQEDEQTNAEDKQDSEEVEYVARRKGLALDAQNAVEALKGKEVEDWDAVYEEITAPVNAAIAKGQLKEKDGIKIKEWVSGKLKNIQKARVKTPWQQATEATTAIRNADRGASSAAATQSPVTILPTTGTAVTTTPVNATEPVKPAQTSGGQKPSNSSEPNSPIKPQPSKVNKYGYKETLGDYVAENKSENNERTQSYTHKNNKTRKTIHKNDDNSYSVSTTIVDNNGNETVRYAGFATLQEAEDNITSGKKPSTPTRTWWASVEKDGKVEVYKGNNTDVGSFKKGLEGKGYKVRFVSTPETFDKKAKEYKEKQKKGATNQNTEKTSDIKKYSSDELEKVSVYDENGAGVLSPIRESADDFLRNKLAKLIEQRTGYKLFFDNKEFVNFMQSHNIFRFVALNSGLLYDVVDGDASSGLVNHRIKVIYVTPEKGTQAAISAHEYTHIWIRDVIANNPKLWAAGVKLLKKTKAWQDVVRIYGYKDEDRIANETLAQLSGVNFQNTLKNFKDQGLSEATFKKLVAWYKKFWQAIKDLFQSEDQRIANMTLEEFVNMPLADLFKNVKADKGNKTGTKQDDTLPLVDYSIPLSRSEASARLETFLRFANKQTQNALSDDKVKNSLLELALKKGLKLGHNFTGSKNRYRAEFQENYANTTRELKASEHAALKYITGIKSEEYGKKTQNTPADGNVPHVTARDETAEKIRNDKDFGEFVNSREIRILEPFKNKKAEERLADIQDTLTREIKDGSTIAEDLREILVKELPSVGKESFGDKFWEYEEKAAKWIAEDLGVDVSKDESVSLERNIILAYYKFLANKYNASGNEVDLLVVPVAKDQTGSKKVQELEARLSSGESRLSIWRETGWYKAKDDHWKYFIDDDLDAIDLSKVTREDGDIADRTEIALGELYANPKLFDKFPYLANIKVKFVRLLGSRGVVKEGKINIKVNKTIPRERIKRVILHEIQHIIQNAEGMAVGTSPKDIVTSYSETVDVYWDKAEQIGAEAQNYLTAYSEWLSYTINPFEEKHTREEKANAKTDYIQAKKSFEAVASAKDKKLLKELLKKIKTLAEKTKENLKNKSKGDNGFNQAYLSALGEEEARLIEYQANASLSEKDKKIKAELLDMLGEMLDEEAELATNYLYGFSRSIDGDVVHTKTEQQEQDALGEELSMFGWGGFVKLLKSADNKTAVADSLAHLHFVLGNDDRSIVFLGDNDKALSVETVDASSPNSLLARGVKAVVTKKPKSIQDDIKAEGWKGWAKHMFRKFYRAWVDKNIDIKDFDDILEGVLGRALSASESIYEKIQMVSSNAAGLTSVLIEGNGKHIKAANSKLKRKGMKYKVSLASVFEEVNDTVMKPYEEYLKQSGCSNWVEALGAYLGWRRLAEMARLHREAFEQEHAEWKARKRAYDEWANSGRIGKNPLLEQYEAWEAYQKNLKNSKRRWERNGKIGPDPTKAIKEEWLATHKDEEAPKRFVGKEPEFVPYKTPKEAGNLTEEELNELIKQAPAPFAEAAKKYYMLNDNILSIMEDAGLIDAKTHELLNEKYKDYCPMIRDFSDTAAVDAYVESITYGGNGVANVSSMLKKIREEGSERTIINPLESTIQTIAAVTNRAERNKAGQHLVMMMNRAEDLKGYIKKLEQPKHGTIQADPKNCIFTVMFNGKKVAYQADPNYYQAIVGYNLPTSSLLMRIPQTAAKCLRTGATMSPSFIVRNILRDTVTAGIASNNSFVPIIDTIRGAMELRNNPEFRAKFEASGVVAFNDYGSAESAYQNLTDMASGKNYSVYEPKKIISGVLQAALKGNGIEALKTLGISLEQLSSYVESATRAGEFKKALDSGKSLEEAAYDAKEVTLNFSRSGIIGQRVNQNVPFFNACIQGGDKMIRLFYENPTSTALKVGLYIILPSLALWWMNHDKDWYEELDPATKYTHWCLPNGVRIPKPQEYGVLWGGGIEAMLDQAFTKDPRAMKEWADAARDAITPSVVPTVVLPLLEWVTNYSFFKGRDLVPQRLQRMPDELQYNTGTSELSKFIGKHTYASPIKIDNLVRGYTGTMGMFLWQTPDWFAAEKQNLPAKELGEMQFIRDFNVTEANRNRYLNDFYELQQKANQQQAGYGLKGKPSAAIKAIRNVGKTINELNKQIRTIEVSDKYSPERKRELIDAKRARIRKAAKLVVQKYGKDFL